MEAGKGERKRILRDKEDQNMLHNETHQILFEKQGV
jgi:hypothetical protein